MIASEQAAAVGFRLSVRQRELWYLARQGRMPVSRVTFHLEGEPGAGANLDSEAWRHALAACAARHEILRTRYLRAGGHRWPIQVADAEPALSWSCVVAPPRGAAAALADAWSAVGEPFDLAAGPLLRAILVNGTEGRWLVVGLPALAADARTLINLHAELQEGTTDGEAVPFLQFSEWQHQLIAEEGELAPAAMELGGDLPWPGEAGGGFQVCEVALDGPEVAAFEQLCARTRTTPQAVLLAAWMLCLARVAGLARARVVTILDGRPFEEVEGVAGPFSRSAVVAAEIDDREPASRFFAAVQKELEEAAGRLDLLAARLEPARGTSAAFRFQALPEPRRGKGVSLGIERLRSEAERFDLELEAERKGNGLALRLHFDSGTLEPGAAFNLLDRLRGLLERLAAQPEVALGALDASTSAERLRRAGSIATTAPVLGGWVHERIAARAAADPEAVAVIFGDSTWTFGHLRRVTRGLAERLRRLGVGPETVVGLHLHRGPELVAAVLATLEAGGAFLPLDPSYPNERLRHMAEDARVALVLTGPDAPLVDFGVSTVPVEVDGADEIDRPPVALTGDHLAYVLFTSGSTGRPKGTMVSHLSLLQYVAWALERYRIGDGQEVPLHSPLGFDLTLTSLFCPLLAGKAVRLARETRGVDGLIEALRASRDISLIKLTPSHLELLSDGLSDEEASRIRTVVIGGEALHFEALAGWRLRSPGTRWINEYGPTETVVGCAAYEVTDQDPVAGPVPIGQPIPGVGLDLIDAGFRPVAEGAVGEIWIDGPGVARGYAGRSDLTAERFVPALRGTEPGARAYRSGDRARLGHRGYEFLGRLDDQIKLRGFRIEPGEVAAALSRHPRVREAAVIARESKTAGLQLLGYVVADGAPFDLLELEEIRRLLGQHLPEHMVPSALIALPELPLTGNGKLDRAALPDPVAAAAGSDGRGALSQTELLLAALWRELLGQERICRNDDFLRAGGHSLLAVQLLSRVRRIFRVDVAVDEFFAAPTVAALAARIDAAFAGGASLAATPIERQPRDRPLPLSFSQERLWVLDRLQPGNPAYNVAAAFRLVGSLDPSALAGALAEVVRRHEVLRSVFADGPEGPVQVPSAWVPTVPEIDLSALATRSTGEAERLLEAVARHPFDLERGPLLRPLLFRSGAAEHRLSFTQHHAVSDGWSTGILLREIAAVYNARVRGLASPLGDLEIQYADFAVWQRAWHSGDRIEKQLDYWRSKLAGLPPLLNLKTDRPRPPFQGRRGGEVTAHLAASWPAFRLLCRRESATLFIGVAALLEALLARYTGQTDLALGVPVAGRGRIEIEPLIGFFTNTIVLRGDLSGRPGFCDLLERTRIAALGAFAHQDVPIEQVIEALGVERDPSRPPLFQVVLASQEEPRSGALSSPAERLIGLEIEAVPVSTRTAKVDLHFDAREVDGESLGVTLQYCADLYDETTAVRILGHLGRLLESASDDPDRPFAELDLLRKEERAQILGAFNPVVEPVSDSWTERFERRAEACPDAVAAVFESSHLSFGELAKRARQLAGHLGRLGVGPEVLVGLAVERSLDLVIGWLGILESGAAFVPLDPSYPIERIAYLFEDSQVPVVVTQSDLVDSLPSHWGATVLLDQAHLFAAGSREAQVVEPPSSSLAYVIYTSGSTGRPKGVAVPRAGLSNLGRRYTDLLGLIAGKRVLQFAPIGFDASVSELIALAEGATLCLAPREQLRDARRLLEFLEQERVTHATLPPSLASVLPAARLEALECLIVAGEACSQSVVDAWAIGRHFIDAYGPTEATVCTSLGFCQAGERQPTIGRPLPGLAVLLLDANFELVPVGIAGELAVRGVGLARGYLNRPDLTALVFVPDPWSKAPGGRLYRTGDLACWLPEGRIDYLGRIDDQIKVRGHRIEPVEVESVLARHPAVREVAVVSVGSDPSSRFLAGFCVPTAEGAIDVADLRSFVSERLPEFMVPSRFVILPELPKTASGKVDRRALPSRFEDAAIQRSVQSVPNGPIEAALVEVWQDILGRTDVTSGDDFFDLGGHSLAATRLLQRVNELFGCGLSLVSFFGRPTVEGLAVSVANALGAPEAGAGPRPVDRSGPLPLSLAQEVMWRADRRAPGAPRWNVPLALRLNGRVDLAALRHAAAEVERRHEALRTRYREGGDGPEQQVVAWARGAFPQVDLIALAEDRDERGRILAASAARGFDLESGPICRWLIVRIGVAQHAVLFVCHHIAIDLRSGQILGRELFELYAALREGRRSNLAPLPLQVGDFAAWQRARDRQAEIAAEVAFWHEKLAGAEALRWPGAAASGGEGSSPYRPTGAALALSAETGGRVAELARRYAATPFMVLLAALDALLALETGQLDLVVRAPVAQRRREIEGLIGFFPVALALRVRLVDDPTFGELVGRVRATTLEAYGRSEVPFEWLAQVAADGTCADLGRVTFNYYDHHGAEPESSAGDLEVLPEPVAPAETEADLVLLLQPEGEGFVGRFGSRAGLLGDENLARLARRYEELIRRALAEPDRMRLSDLAKGREENSADMMIS
jgi:amino acid adenylation domain-containing protein